MNKLLGKLHTLLTVPGAGNRASSLEGLRGYAAGIVFLLHFTGSFFKTRLAIDLDDVSFLQLGEQSPWYALGYWFFSSHYGVDIFFLISGFLIARLCMRDGFNYGVFIWHRLFRIYPVLIVSTLLYVLVSAVISGKLPWLGGIVGNLFLLNGVPGLNFPAINVVTWSIFFEFAFYIVFPALWVLSGARFPRTFFFALLVLFALTWVNPAYFKYVMFLAGVLLSVMPRKLGAFDARVPDAAIFLLYLASTFFFVFEKRDLPHLIVYVGPALLFVHRVVHGSGWLFSMFSNRYARYFGNISFSFYIWHPLAIKFAGMVCAPLVASSAPVFLVGYFLVASSFALALGAASFIFLERPYFSNKRLVDGAYALFSRPFSGGAKRQGAGVETPRVEEAAGLIPRDRT